MPSAMSFLVISTWISLSSAAMTVPARPSPRAAQFISRRAAFASSLLALTAQPQMCRAEFWGYADGKEMQRDIKELDTSPLIEELKRRTAENKEKNAATVKEATSAGNSQYDGQVDMKMVRYIGEGDTMPVTRMMGTDQIAKLESMGYKVKCPTWGGACELVEPKGGARRAPPPKPEPEPEPEPRVPEPPAVVEAPAKPERGFRRK